MDIHSPKGTRVRFTGCDNEEQIKWGNHTDPRGLLDLETTYTVERTEVHTWHTRVFLERFPGKYFNSGWFEEAREA